MSEVTVLAEGLRFPEGPIAMNDGSVILVEIARGTLSKVVDGDIQVIAELGRPKQRRQSCGVIVARQVGPAAGSPGYIARLSPARQRACE